MAGDAALMLLLLFIAYSQSAYMVSSDGNVQIACLVFWKSLDLHVICTMLSDPSSQKRCYKHKLLFPCITFFKWV